MVGTGLSPARSLSEAPGLLLKQTPGAPPRCSRRFGRVGGGWACTGVWGAGSSALSLSGLILRNPFLVFSGCRLYGSLLKNSCTPPPPSVWPACPASRLLPPRPPPRSALREPLSLLPRLCPARSTSVLFRPHPSWFLLLSNPRSQAAGQVPFCCHCTARKPRLSEEQPERGLGRPSARGPVPGLRQAPHTSRPSPTLRRVQGGAPSLPVAVP